MRLSLLMPLLLLAISCEPVSEVATPEDYCREAAISAANRTVECTGNTNAGNRRAESIDDLECREELFGEATGDDALDCVLALNSMECDALSGLDDDLNTVLWEAGCNVIIRGLEDPTLIEEETELTIETSGLLTEDEAVLGSCELHETSGTSCVDYLTSVTEPPDSSAGELRCANETDEDGIIIDTSWRPGVSCFGESIVAACKGGDRITYTDESSEVSREEDNSRCVSDGSDYYTFD